VEKWEYKTIKVDPKGLADGALDTGNFNMVINQLGSVGWELVSCFTTSQSQLNTKEVVTVFKRKINGGSADTEDKSPDTRGRGRAYTEKRFRTSGEETRTYEEKPRTYGEKPRTFGKSSGYKEKGSGYSGKGSGYSGKGPGRSGKSSGYSGKGSGYSGKGTKN
jgi:hypothetical protein